MEVTVFAQRTDGMLGTLGQRFLDAGTRILNGHTVDFTRESRGREEEGG